MCMAPRPPERLGGGPTLHTAGLPRLPGPAHHLAGGGGVSLLPPAWGWASGGGLGAATKLFLLTCAELGGGGEPA